MKLSTQILLLFLSNQHKINTMLLELIDEMHIFGDCDSKDVDRVKRLLTEQAVNYQTLSRELKGA